jgi:hypothetical protein
MTDSATPGSAAAAPYDATTKQKGAGKTSRIPI